MMNIDEILLKYAQRKTTLEEQQSFEEWFYSLSNLQREEVLEKYGSIVAMQDNMQEVADADLLKNIHRVIAAEEYRVPVVRMKWWHYAVALVVLAVGVGVYYFGNYSQKPDTIIGGTRGTGESRGNIAPGGNKAIWTLADGKKIELDSTVLDMTAERSHVEVNGYNELSTPRGGQYQLVLPDGSKAWLNAASYIKYPVVFSGKERHVTISGEVYFEIAKDVSMPFKVSVAEQEIEVLGTAFNVYAYNDEPFKTSLAEGAIKINQQVLKPGQAYFKGKIVITNVEEDLAWKNGLFQFNNTPLPIVLKQIARWYDVSIQYKDLAAAEKLLFTGKLYRNLSLQDLIKGFQETDIPLEWDGEKIMVN